MLTKIDWKYCMQADCYSNLDLELSAVTDMPYSSIINKGVKGVHIAGETFTHINIEPFLILERTRIQDHK